MCGVKFLFKGTEPKQPDDAYQKFELDASTNLLWAEDCRGPRIERVFRVYPPDAQDWAKKKGLTLAPGDGLQVTGCKFQVAG